MSALLNQTSVNPNTFLFGSGGGLGDVSSIATVAGNISTILESYPGAGRVQTTSSGTVVGDITFDSVIGGVRIGDSFGNEAQFANGIFTCAVVSTPQVYSQTISTTYVDLDGQVLTANPSELLLNGVPLATLSNLSSIGDWAEEPAVSTIQAAGFQMIDVPQITGFNDLLVVKGNALGPNLSLAWDAIDNVSSQFIFDTGAGPLMRYRAGNLDVSSITTSNITAVTATALSTLTVISTISSLVLEGNLVQTSTLFASDFLSTPDIEVSTINGAQFGNSSITVEVVGVSSLVANTISSLGAEIRTALVSTLQFNPTFSPNLDVNLGLGSLFGNLAGAAAGGIGVLVGAAGLGTGIAALAQGRQTNYINSNNYELVNGTTQLQISTLGTPFSTVYRFVSSVAENVPGEEYFVSSIHSPGVAIRSLSDPLNTVSAPTSTIQSFGQWVALDANLPIPSTVSSFQQLFTSSLATSTILTQAGTGVRGGAPFFNSGAGMSTLEVYEASAPQYSGALRANQINFSFAGLTSNDFAQDVVLASQGSNNRLTTGGGRVVAYLSDIPAPSPTISSFVDLGTDTLRVSTINMEGTGVIVWDNNASIYEVSPNRLFFTNGSATTIDMDSGQIVFNEGGAGGQMRFVDNTLEVSAISTLTMNVGVTLSSQQTFVSSLNGGIPYTTANPQPPAPVDFSSIFTSSIQSIGAVSSIVIIGNSNNRVSLANTGDVDIVGRDIQIQAQGSNTTTFFISGNTGGGQGSWSNGTVGAGFLNASSIRMSTNQVQCVNFSTALTTLSTLTFTGISTVSFTTSSNVGAQSQPAGRLVMSGADLDLGQNDLYVQQIRVGLGNPGGSAQSEIIFAAPNNASQRSIGMAGDDLTLRIQSTINTGTNNGYILDTSYNKPFFSTLNGTSTALMAVFPSTNLSTLGVSTLSVLPPLPAASFFSRSTQTVAANTPLTLWHEVAGVSVGNPFTQSTNTIVIPQNGVYDIETSIQFDKSGGGVTVADFWFRKNGTDIPDSASEITIQGNNGEVLGNVSILESFIAGDKLEIVIASADNTLGATFFQSTVTTPYTRPAIPSVITNIKQIG